jgi:DNA-binding transcriptional MerR regulator
MRRVNLLRMGELAKRSNVSVATLKFYLREGLIAPVRKSGATMSWYAPSTVARIHAIRELKEKQFLPLDVIRQTLESDVQADSDQAMVDAIAGVFARHGSTRARSREELLARGVSPMELQWLAATKLAEPDADGMYRNDDLALLATLGAARKAGIVEDMLPFNILADYMRALNQLVATELALFRGGVLKRARAKDIEPLTKTATELSERLVVLIRRKLLVPTLRRMIEEESHEEPVDRSNRPSSSVRKHGKPRRRRQPARRKHVAS